MGQPLLREENIVACLKAVDVETAFRQLMEILPVWKMDPSSKERVLERLLLRERVGTTAIGQGIALPHCFSPDVTEPVVVFGVSSEGIPYPSLDGRPVHFVFLLILPQNEAAQQMKCEILQNIKWLLCDRFLQERLKAVQSASEVFALLSPNTEHETVLIKTS